MLVNKLKNRKTPLQERVRIATQLWERQNEITSCLKSFKAELSHLAEQEGSDLEIRSEGCMALVQKQPPTPKLEPFNMDALKLALGDELFEKYIAHSYTLRWSEFRNAPQSVKDQFYSLPELETTQTYQVKFKRS